MNKITKMMATGLLAAIALPVLAQTPAPNTSRIDKREARQQQRIDQGVKSGQITPREAARLQKGQQRIERMEANAKADGRVTKRERAAIERAQDRQSKAIARESHDKQKLRK
jgi:uncharacterized membrane protein YebE (DUF533 family)